MLNAGKHNVLGVFIDAVDYETAEEKIVSAALAKRPLSVSALAVHGLMTGVLDPEHRYRLNRFELLVPDGQPVRWALNSLHGTKLRDRVYGPNLTLRVCAAAERHGLSTYFYGSTPEVLASMRVSLRRRFPNLQVAGMEPSKFRNLTVSEKSEVVDRIGASGAQIVFVGLGCPRQEIFAYEFHDVIAGPVLAVGAAFPFLAGTLPQAPARLQRLGLEWLFRLYTEPKRLWRRYMLLNPYYLFLLGLQAAHLRSFDSPGTPPSRELLYG